MNFGQKINQQYTKCQNCGDIRGCSYYACIGCNICTGCLKCKICQKCGLCKKCCSYSQKEDESILSYLFIDGDINLDLIKWCELCKPFEIK